MIRFIVTCLTLFTMTLSLSLSSPAMALDASRFPIQPTMDANGRWTLVVPKGMHLAFMASSNTHVFREICNGKRPINVDRTMHLDGSKTFQFDCKGWKKKSA